MSKQRLSKLQKWILENCFRVTVLADRTALKKLNNIGGSRKCGDCPKTRESIHLKKDQYNFITHQCVKDGDSCKYFEFYKEDSLLSFFSLKPNNDKAHFSKVQHFYNSHDYAKVHVTVHRSISNLVEKGLVYYWCIFREDSMLISLTEEGIKKAAELKGIEDYAALFKS